MHVDAAVFRAGENRSRQDKTVSRHDENIRSHREHIGERSFVAKGHGLEQMQPAFRRQHFYRRGFDFQPATLRPIRLRQDNRNIERDGKERLEHHGREGWRTREPDTKRRGRDGNLVDFERRSERDANEGRANRTAKSDQPASRCFLRSLADKRARFNGERWSTNTLPIR